MAWLEFQTASGSAIIRRQLFTANGTWTKPDKIVGDQVWITAIGGGGSGNSSTNDLGGCSGAYITRFPVDVSGTTSESITVGAGGALVNGAGTNTAGNAGAPSSFGSLVSVDGAVAASVNLLYISPLDGQNPGCNSGDFLSSISGVFGATIAAYVGGQSGLGGSGLLLDASGIRAGDGNNEVSSPGGNGYGAGGGSRASSNATNSGAGAPGAVLVEWLEKV